MQRPEGATYWGGLDLLKSYSIKPEGKYRQEATASQKIEVKSDTQTKLREHSTADSLDLAIVRSIIKFAQPLHTMCCLGQSVFTVLSRFLGPCTGRKYRLKPMEFGS